MARKNIARAFRTKRAQSLAASFQTSPINVDYLDNVVFTVETASVTDNTGTFGVEARLKGDNNEASAWFPLELSLVPTLANANDKIVIKLDNVPFSEVRLTFAAAGATPDGTCDVWVEAKQLGG